MAIVIDPTTGQPVDNGQPDLPGGPANVNGLIPQIVGGGLQVGIGGVAAPFAAGIDAARRGLTSLAGGNPQTLSGGPTQFSDAAFGLIGQGANDVSQGISGIGQEAQAGLRQSLGVQPAPLTVPTAAAPQVTPLATDSGPQPRGLAVPFLTPAQPLAPAPQQVAPFAPTQVQSFNVQGTPTRGFTGGFGTDASGNPLNASQYLAKMSAQDQAQDQIAYSRQQQAQSDLAFSQGLTRLQNAQGNPELFNQVLAEQHLITHEGDIGTTARDAASQAQSTAATENQNKLQVAGINNTAEAQRALAAQQAALTQASTVANLTGNYGLRDAQIKADIENTKNQISLIGPEAQKSLAEAQGTSAIQAAALARYNLSPKAPSDLAAYVSDLKPGQVRSQPVAPYGTDVVSGVPFTQQTAQTLQQAALITAQRAAAKLQSQ